MPSFIIINFFFFLNFNFIFFRRNFIISIISITQRPALEFTAFHKNIKIHKFIENYEFVVFVENYEFVENVENIENYEFVEYFEFI